MTEADETPLYTDTVAATGVDPQQYWDQIAAEVRAIQEEFSRTMKLSTQTGASDD